MAINVITREWTKENNIDFDMLIDEFDEDSYEKHRRGSNFFVRSILHITEEHFPELPKELHGYWETNTYIKDDNDGRDRDEITKLTRVEQKERIIKELYWTPVQEIGDVPSIPPLPKMD